MEWVSLASVIMINLVLSSDNALAIAMASRKIPFPYRRKAIVGGSICAVGMQILFTYMAALLLSIPYVKIGGGMLLSWIAYHLAATEDSQEDECCERQCTSQFAAIKMIAAANIVMCLDNVLAVAAVAAGNTVALCAGLLISCPIIMGGSVAVAALMERFPIIIWVGAVFLGWTAGGIIVSDNAVMELLQRENVSSVCVQALFPILISYGAWRKAAEKITLCRRSAKS